MVFRRTERFKKSYQRLSGLDQDRVDEVLRLFADNPYHPSLATKKLPPKTSGIWYFRASRAIRVTFEWDGADVLLRNVGSHSIL